MFNHKGERFKGEPRGAFRKTKYVCICGFENHHVKTLSFFFSRANVSMQEHSPVQRKAFFFILFSGVICSRSKVLL